MSGVDWIWLLENRNKSLNKSEEQLSSIYRDLGIKELEAENNELNSRYENLKENIKRNKRKINKYESLLNQYNYTITEIDKDLYNGNINDLKQLQYLNEEKEKGLNTINNLELDIIFMLEKEEDMIIALENIIKGLDETDLELKRVKQELKHKKTYLSEKIKKELDTIEEIKSNISTKTLDKYNNIRRTKITAIVPIKDSICTGCNMRIPTYLLKPIKEKKEIIYCENCGRILYYMEDKELSLV